MSKILLETCSFYEPSSFRKRALRLTTIPLFLLHVKCNSVINMINTSSSVISIVRLLLLVTIFQAAFNTAIFPSQGSSNACLTPCRITCGQIYYISEDSLGWDDFSRNKRIFLLATTCCLQDLPIVHSMRRPFCCWSLGFHPSILGQKLLFTFHE